MRFIALGLLLLTGFHHGALADQIYRCKGDAGEPVFSFQPCNSAPGSAVYRATAPTEAAQGLRPGEAQWLDARDRRRADAKPASRKVRRSGSNSAASAARKQVYRCQRTRAKLDKVRSTLRRGYKPATGERLRRKRREYEDYLDVFCS